MQENTELLEAGLTKALPIFGEVLEENSSVKEVCTQDREVELARLVACVTADVNRSKRRVTTYKRVFSIVTIPSVFALLTLILAPFFLSFSGSGYYDRHVVDAILRVAGTCGCAMLGVLAGLVWIRGEGSGKDPAVRDAAWACREAIRQQMALARSGEQLLRASAPTPAGRESLLRPVQTASQTDPQELLRSSDPTLSPP